MGDGGTGPSCHCLWELQVSAFLLLLARTPGDPVLRERGFSSEPNTCVPSSPPLFVSPFLTCPLQSTMKLIILDHYSQASEWAAKYIRNRIIQFNPGPDKYFTLGLPTGA